MSANAATLRRPTVEWQVCGVCNYDCSYCIQSREYRVGQPSAEQIERLLRFFAALPGRWEIKMTGGEPFAFRGFMERIVPGLIAETPHTISVLSNLSAPLSVLKRFADLTRGRLGIVSASVHLEFVAVDEFVAKAAAFRELIDPSARMVVNGVLVPGKLDQVSAAAAALRAAALQFFPQLMKIGGGVHEYSESDRPIVDELVGISPGKPGMPTPRQANLSPSYRGLTCWTGVEYFVLMQNGDGWSCRTAKRFREGYLGNALDGTFRLAEGPVRCTYDICPCTVPANRGMIEGIGESQA